jgi:hypothetical protein
MLLSFVLSLCCLGSGVLTLGKLKVAWGSNRKLAGLFGGSGTGFKWRAGGLALGGVLACGVGTAGGLGCGFGIRSDSVRGDGQGRSA